MNPFEIELIQTYAACDMNVVQTAKKVFVCRNTVHYHFDKVKKRTGLDPRTFSGLTELLSRIERGEAED